MPPPPGVALTTGSDSANGGSYVTASVTPTANRLVLASIVVSVAAGGITPDMVCSGNGLTWVQVVRNALDNQRCAYVFRAMGAAPAAGAVTFSTAGGTTDLTAAVWQVAEYADVDTSGTDGSGAVVQSAQARAASVTFAAAVGAGNSVYGWGGSSGAVALTAGSGFVELAPVQQVATPGSSALGETAEPAVNTVAVTLAEFLVGVEVKAAASGVVGTGALTAAPATLSGTGTLTVAGSGTLTAPATTATGAGTATVTGGGSLVAAAGALAGSGSVGGVTGTGALTAPAATASGSASVLGRVFRTPTEDFPFRMAGRALWGVEPYGKSVWRSGGTWFTGHAPSAADLAAADRFYGGGRVHVLTAEQEAELIAAGFGAYITQE